MITRDDFESIVRKHQAMLYSVAYNFFHNAHVAEEVAQDVFLLLYEHLGDIESDAHLTAWLRRAAIHRSIDILRRRSTQNEQAFDRLPDVVDERPESDPLLSEKLQCLVASLPEKQRIVIILRYGEDMDSEEIGRLLDMPAATVRSHLQRAIAMLREKAPRLLGEELDGSFRKRSS